MIFVTVGTHEQPFNRLLEYIDGLKKQGTIAEPVIMQTGFSTYQPEFCEWERLFPFSRMQELIEEARIVITHGGPSSFLTPLRLGKIPIVVPRQRQYGEHINDHQTDFCREVARRHKNIIEVEEITMLGGILQNYDTITSRMEFDQKSNNQKFCEEFAEMVRALFGSGERE